MALILNQREKISMAKQRINTERLTEILNEQGNTHDHVFDSKTLGADKKSTAGIQKMNTKAHEDYLKMRVEQDQEERTADYRRRLGITDNTKTLDDLMLLVPKKSEVPNNLTNKETRTMSTNILGDIITTASNKPVFSEIIEQTETYRRRMPVNQSDLRHLNLRELQIRDTLTHSSVPALAQPGSPGVVSQIAPLTIAGASRVIQAGSNLMLVSSDTRPLNGQDRAGYFYEDATVFIQSEPAKFQPIQEGANVPESDSPVYREILYKLAVKSYMFSTKIDRRRQERFFANELEESLMKSIMLGIANAADKALLERILISGYSDPYLANSYVPPETFSLAKVAARGLRFGDLSAIIGTAGNGAAINQNGQLVAGGVQAEFSDAIPETIIGAFSKSAVTIGQDITLIANRSGANALDGSMTVTCIAEIGTLIPVGGSLLPFWIAS